MGSQTNKTPAANYLYKSIFLIATFGIAFYQSNLSMANVQELWGDLLPGGHQLPHGLIRILPVLLSLLHWTLAR